MSETDTEPQAMTNPAPPAQHVPLITRMTDLESRFAQLVDLHNKLAADTARELGL